MEFYFVLNLLKTVVYILAAQRLKGPLGMRHLNVVNFENLTYMKKI